MADIFLSYAREDSELAKRLSERLESLGWSVWWDREIPAGQTWRDVIEQSLATMGCMVVLWSKQSIHSDWVKEEAEEGQAQRKLVPALIDNVKPPMGFRAIQAADLIDWDGSNDFLGFNNLIEALTHHLGKPVKVPSERPASTSETDRADRQQPDQFAFPKLLHWANKLPWWSYATATVLVTMLIAASIGHDDPSRQYSAKVSLPVNNLDAGEMQPATPLTIRGPSLITPPVTKLPEHAPTPAIGNARDVSAETKPAKKIEAAKSKHTPIPTTAPNNYRCSEILARAQLGEPLSDADRDALRKECQS